MGQSGSDFAALLSAVVAGFEADLAFGVVVGVCLAGFRALFAGISAEFGDGGQQCGLLRGEAVGGVAQRQHLIDGFGAVAEALVAVGQEAQAVGKAGTTGGEAGGGCLDECVVRVGRAVGVFVLVFFGAGSRGESEGSGSSAAEE